MKSFIEFFKEDVTKTLPRKPMVIKTKGKRNDPFYISKSSDVRNVLGTSYSVEDAAKVYGDDNMSFGDNIVLYFTVEDLFKYRSQEINTGKSNDRYERFKEFIKKRGIKDTLEISMTKMRNGEIYVSLITGNNTISAAMNIGGSILKSRVPVRIHYQEK